MYYQRDKKGIKIHLKVMPNSAKNAICGVTEGENGLTILKVKIAAAPDDGKANKELINFLSKEWKIAKSEISIISGETSRRKTLLIPDCDYFSDK